MASDPNDRSKPGDRITDRSAPNDPQGTARDVSHRDAPRSLADWIPQVLQEMGLGGVNDGAKLLAAWSRAVGPGLAVHTRPQGIRRGVVHVTVRDSAWMQRMQMEKAHVLEELRRELGSERVRDLRLRIAPMS